MNKNCNALESLSLILPNIDGIQTCEVSTDEVIQSIVLKEIIVLNDNIFQTEQPLTCYELNF